MAFPTTPTNGQVVVVNNINYQYANTTNTWTRILTTANVITANTIAVNGALSAAGNITTGNYFIGNGSLLTGIATGTPTLIANGTSNVVVTSSGGNIRVNVGGTSNVIVYATTGEYVTGIISASGNITGSNLTTGGSLSIGGNVIGNLLPSANITYDLGSTTQRWRDLWLSNSTIYLGNAQISANATAITITNPAGGTTVLQGASPSITGAVVSASGNVTGGNILTGGLVSATSTITSAANITGGNLLTGGLVSATGTITGSSYLGSVVSVTANVTGGNLLTAGLISATGNITGANLLINNDATITGNLTVNGNTTFINSNVVTTNDKSITLANNQSTAANVDGAGIDIGNATVAYWRFNNATTSWQSNIGLTPASNATLSLGGASNYWGAAFLNQANIATTISAVGNITGGNILTAGQVSATGNATVGNLIVPGLISVVGNIIATTITTTVGSNGNLVLDPDGVGDVVLPVNTELYVQSTANSTSTSVGAVVISGGMGIAGNIYSGGLISATSTVTGSSVLGTVISASGNVTGGNILTAGLISATSTITSAANITGGNLLTAGLVSATGNVTGNYILGNGALLTGVITSVANINNGTSNVTVVSSGGNVTVGVGGTSNVVVWATSGEYVTGVVSASGNVQGGNIRTAGIVSATGNITGNYFVGNGSQLTGITASSGAGNLWVVGRLATYYVPIINGILNIVGRTGNILVPINS